MNVETGSITPWGSSDGRALTVLVLQGIARRTMVARRLVTEKGSRNRTGKRTVEKIASVDLTARPCPEGKWQLHSNLTDMDRRAVYALADRKSVV